MRWMSCNMKAFLPWQWCQVINFLCCWKSISVFITHWTQKSNCSSDKGPIEKLRHKFFAEQIFTIHMIELSNYPAVLASIALFKWDWNQNIFFFNHDIKGSVPFNSKTAHPWTYPGIWLEFLSAQWGNWPKTEACLGGHLTFMSKCWSASQTKGFHNSFIQHVHCIHESLLLNSLFCWSIWEPLKSPLKWTSQN